MEQVLGSCPCSERGLSQNKYYKSIFSTPGGCLCIYMSLLTELGCDIRSLVNVGNPSGDIWAIGQFLVIASHSLSQQVIVSQKSHYETDLRILFKKHGVGLSMEQIQLHHLCPQAASIFIFNSPLSKDVTQSQFVLMWGT